MRIRPYVVTGLATLIAGSALAVLILTHDPYQAEPIVRGLFWVALPLCAWMFLSTLLVVARAPLAVALWCSLLWVVVASGMLAYSRGHVVPSWLLGTVILATLGMTEYLRRLVSPQ